MQLDYAIDILPKNWPTTRRERCHEETEVPNIVICANKGCALQKRILSTILEVFRPRESKLRNERSPRRYLRKPLRRTIISTQVDPSRILLAYNAKGHASLCQVLRQVLEVQQFHQTIIRRTNTHDGPLVIRSMGSRYHGPLPDRS